MTLCPPGYHRKVGFHFVFRKVKLTMPYVLADS